MCSDKKQRQHDISQLLREGCVLDAGALPVIGAQLSLNQLCFFNLYWGSSERGLVTSLVRWLMQPL